MRGTVIEPGYYLVGRHDGEVDEFFVRVYIDEEGDKCVSHHVDQNMIDCAIECVADWWWQEMTEETVPKNWSAYPASIKEPPYE